MNIPPNWANTYPLIKTEGELIDLPSETVLRDSAGDVWECWGWVADEECPWFTVGDEHGRTISRVTLPAVVIWAQDPHE